MDLPCRETPVFSFSALFILVGNLQSSARQGMEQSLEVSSRRRGVLIQFQSFRIQGVNREKQ